MINDVLVKGTISDSTGLINIFKTLQKTKENACKKLHKFDRKTAFHQISFRGS